MLVRRRDRERRGVVVGPEVGGAAAAAPGLDDPKQGNRSALADDRLRRLDHDLGMERAFWQPERALESLEEVGERGDLLGDGHLGQRDDEVLRQPASGVADQLREEDVESPEASPRELPGEGLDADADRGRQCPGRETRRDLARRGDGVAVFLGVGAIAVAVLEVDAEVFDRLPPELLDDARIDHVGERARQAEYAREGLRTRGELGERVERERSQPGGGVGVKKVRAPVDRMDRLASAGLPRIAPREGGVGGLQALFGSGHDLVGKCRPRAQVVSFQKRSRRLPQTRRRYAAVDRRSSIGWISSIRISRASPIEAPDARASSVLIARRTVGATLPRAIRGSGARTAAITTFEIACAARVPTLRNHWRPATGAISMATSSSSGRITVER